MGQAQDVAIKMMGVALMFAGVLCIIKGGFGVHKGSAGGNDDINIAGWKTLGSWWAMGGVILAGGTYAAFGRFFNSIFTYLFGG